MKPPHEAGSSCLAKALSLAVLLTTASCGLLIGIEDLNAEGGPPGSGGASGADASTDRTGSGGSGGTGGGTGGGSGSSGASLDANADQLSEGSPPVVDGTSDVRVDLASEARAPDAIDDRTTTETASPDGGALDTSADTGDTSNVADTSDGGIPIDAASPDTANPDTGAPDTMSPDVVVDAPVVDVGSDRPPTLTVTGRIIDYWRHPVPSVPVTIGTAATTTDVNGQFTVSGVTAPYDVLFTISTIVNNTSAKYGWLYKGLTRTDPTLQVGRGFPERAASTFDIHVGSVDFMNFPANDTVHTSFGGADGAFDTDVTYIDTPYINSSWFGPTTASMNGHALHWTRATSTTLDLPTGYHSYDTHSVSLVDSNVGNISFDLPGMPGMTTGQLAGTVTPSASGGSRQNDVFLRFADNAVMQLASDASQPTTFTYLTPSIAQSTLTFAASQGDWYNPPYAVIHKDGLPYAQTGISLQIPDTPSLIAPAAGATGVNQSTLFRWSGTAKVFLWGINFTNEYKGFFVVTTEKQGLIAAMPDGPALPPNSPFWWWVETDGSYQTVDEATGTNGMLDSYRTGVLWGAARGDGSYTSSEENAFTSAP